MAECIQIFYGGSNMERDPQCIVVKRDNGSTHLLHVQTRVAVLDVEKLRRVASCDGVTPRAKDLALRKLEILERDGFACVKCKETQCLTIDHIEKIAEKHMFDRYSGRVRYQLCQTIRSTAEGYPVEECQTVCVWCHGVKDGWLSAKHDEWGWNGADAR